MSVSRCLLEWYTQAWLREGARSGQEAAARTREMARLEWRMAEAIGLRGTYEAIRSAAGEYGLDLRPVWAIQEEWEGQLPSAKAGGLSLAPSETCQLARDVLRRPRP